MDIELIELGVGAHSLDPTLASQKPLLPAKFTDNLSGGYNKVGF
jgi:hypothetical protein